MTERERRQGLGFGKPGNLSPPDGEIDEQDKLALLGLYGLEGPVIPEATGIPAGVILDLQPLTGDFTLQFREQAGALWFQTATVDIGDIGTGLWRSR